MNRAIDFGCNFGSIKRYPLEKLHRVLSHAKENGIEKCLVISNSLSETTHITKNLIPESGNAPTDNGPHAQEALALRKEMLVFSVGIHPHNANRFRPHRDLPHIRDVYVNAFPTQCVAIGEMGLDYNRLFSTKDEQIIAFESQLILAKELNATMYCHVRDAFEDFRSILERNQYFKGIIHCFTGSKDEALYYIDKGFYLGITGVLMDKRRNHSVVEVVREAPLDRLIVETDAPFMGYFGQKESFPQDVFHLIQEIAKLKGVSEEDCCEQLYLNTLTLMLR